MRALIFLFCLAGIGLSASSVSAQERGRPPAPVVVAPVLQAEIRTGQSFVATIVPLQRAVIGSAVDGRVEEYYVNEGDRVEANSPLALLKTETIRLELAAAKAELKLREAEAKELEKEREEIKRQADAEMREAEAALKYAQRSRDRIQRLSERGNAATQEELDQALSLYDKAVAILDQKRAARDLAFAGARQEKRDQAAARVEMQQHVVDKLEDQLKKHTMYTRFAGYVVKELTEVGEWVNRGDPVAEVVALDEVDVLTYVLESQVPYVKIGQQCQVEVTALTGADRYPLGEVAIILPEGDSRSRTFPVKVRVPNKVPELTNEDGDVIGKGQPLYKAGMLARVTLPTDQFAKRLLVMKDALVLDGPKPAVYVVSSVDGDGQPTAQWRSVELGIVSGALQEVEGELAAGDRVVVQGNERLRNGQPVRIQSERTREELLREIPEDNTTEAGARAAGR